MKIDEFLARASDEDTLNWNLIHDLSDLQLIEFLLNLLDEDNSVSVVSDSLMKRFGSLGAIFAAELDDVVKVSGASRAAAILFKFMNTLSLRVLKSELPKRIGLSGSAELKLYLIEKMRHDFRERCYVMYLDGSSSLINDEEHSIGDASSTAVYVSGIVRRALDFGARSIIIVHNHPSRTPHPSRSDILTINKLSDACATFDITVLDSIIIAGDEYVSMRELGNFNASQRLK